MVEKKKILDSAGLEVLWSIVKGSITNIVLKRDSEAAYDPAWKPAKGQVCLVDTTRDGLRVKVGDGNTTFANLPFADEDNHIVICAFYDATTKKFYYEQSFTNAVVGKTNTLYLDLTTNALYFYKDEAFKQLNYVPAASETTAGTMKLYKQTGVNEDGTMTQKSISDELDRKFAVSISAGSLIFTK